MTEFKKNNLKLLIEAKMNVYSSLYLLPVFGLQIQQMNSLVLANDHLSGNIQKLISSTSVGDSNMTVTLFGSEIIYDIFIEYDFFIPEVDVVCQCGCTNERSESCRPPDHECAILINSTTTCTNHITVDSDLSICSKYYKLCCQIYLTKAKIMKPFKALHLKYRETVLTLNIQSQSIETKPTIYNVTEHTKSFLVGHDKVLHILEFIPVRVIPDGWYFIEINSDELMYSDAINRVDELNMNNIGWFQYNDNKKELSRVSTWDLEKHLHVKLLDCHSNPSKYEWELDAIHYVSKGLLHLPKNVGKVSEKYKDILKLSIDCKEEKIGMRLFSPPIVNFTLFHVNSFPFIFTSIIKERVLNLTFIKGNGTFDVEVTSRHWTDIFSFSVSSTGKIIKLPSLNNDSCSVCVSQNNEQLCEIPSLGKNNEDYGKPVPIVGLNNNPGNNEISYEELKTEIYYRYNGDSSKSVDKIVTILILSIEVLLMSK